ncbi:MAG: 1-acyl-sn-glycerol-3-phosphate acyltransferase [Nitrosomonadales bacterium]|nr:1-acyl-sn-glycerol-3-phosphate acyltransferase [Nitrosomonadales bacterium]
MINTATRSWGRLATVLRSLYEYVVLYGSLALFGAAGLTYTIVGAVLYPLLPRRSGARLGRLIMTGIFRPYIVIIKASGLVQCDLSALDALAGGEAVIVAPNHPSLIDVVLIGSRLTNIVCIMKANIQDNILFGGGARLAGYIRNDSTGNMVRTSVAELKDGSQLLIFPEGTRTTRHPVNKFKSAFALIARRSGVPVQSVFIESNTQFLGKGWPLLKKPQFPLIYKVTLGKRFEVTGDTKAFVDDLEKYYREHFAEKNCN